MEISGSFSRISPISVPIPKYVGEHFIGYKKIDGESLHPRQIEKLTKEDRLKIAKQLGMLGFCYTCANS